jgi:predicted glycosyltransferase
MSQRDGRNNIDDRHLPPATRSGPRPRRPRVALYSHDTMGLGHMRRNLLIAQTLVKSPAAPIVLMLAGAREAGALPLPPGVDCFTLPALGKDRDGHLRARDLDLSSSELVELRSRALAAAIASFRPDVLIVDKVPRGASHELVPALEALKQAGDCRCVLGLRDVLDDPETVRREWRDSASDEAIRRYYDAIWVYGDPVLYDPVREYGFSAHVAEKVRYTGYLDQCRRLDEGRPDPEDRPASLGFPDGRLVLCQLGGGQDGAGLAEAFVQAEIPDECHGVLLTGPYLPAEVRARVRRAAAARPRMQVLETLREPGWLLRRADRVIAMGGYNTVCEVLSFEKPALIVPRIHPRREQWIRAERLRSHGLLDVLHPDDLNPRALGRWMASEQAPRPSARDRFDWNGLENLPRFLSDLLAAPSRNTWYTDTDREAPGCYAMTLSASAML